MGRSQSPTYERVRGSASAKGHHSTRRGLPSGRIQNKQRKPPPRVAAMFEELLSRSLRVAGENQQLQRITAEAHAKFREELARLMESLAQQLRLSGIAKDLAALRKRQAALVRDAMEKTQTSIARERIVPGRAKNLRTRNTH